MKKRMGDVLIRLLAVVIVCIVCARLYMGGKVLRRDLFAELLAAAG